MLPILANCPGSEPRPDMTAEATSPPTRLRDLWPAMALGLTGLLWLIGATLTGPGSGGQLLVIGPPALDRDGVSGIVWQAGGAVIGSGGLPNIAVAAATRPDFATALTAAGAWLVLPSPRLLGCFSASGGATE